MIIAGFLYQWSLYHCFQHFLYSKVLQENAQVSRDSGICEMGPAKGKAVNMQVLQALPWGPQLGIMLKGARSVYGVRGSPEMTNPRWEHLLDPILKASHLAY